MELLAIDIPRGHLRVVSSSGQRIQGILTAVRTDDAGQPICLLISQPYEEGEQKLVLETIVPWHQVYKIEFGDLPSGS
jgi:hypothetical protein